MSAVASINAGIQIGRARLVGRPALLAVVAALLATIVMAALERAAGAAGAGDRTLIGVFRLVVPLVSFALLHIAIGPRNLRDAAWPAARFGHHRGLVALGLALAGGIAAALASLLVATTGLLLARANAPVQSGDMPLAADLLATGFAAVTVALGYGAWLALGATFGRLGGGRALVLLADFVVGSVGFFAVVLPRGAAYSLIGREAALELSQRTSSLVLGLVTIVCLTLAALRCRS